MKKYNFPHLISLLGMPIFTTVLGLVLLLSPDTASALVGRLVAWVCILTAVAMIIGLRRISLFGNNNQILWIVIFLAAGLWMLRNPLSIAKFLGRVLGIALMIRGGRASGRSAGYRAGHLVIGAVLVILPMISSRMLFNLVGIVMLLLGVTEAVSRLRGRKLLDEGHDPNIIDVEKL